MRVRSKIIRTNLFILIALKLCSCGTSTPVDESITSSGQYLTGTISGNPANIHSITLGLNGEPLRTSESVPLTPRDLLSCNVTYSAPEASELVINLVVQSESSPSTPFISEPLQNNEGIRASELMDLLPGRVTCRAKIIQDGQTLTEGESIPIGGIPRPGPGAGISINAQGANSL